MFKRGFKIVVGDLSIKSLFQVQNILTQFLLFSVPPALASLHGEGVPERLGLLPDTLPHRFHKEQGPEGPGEGQGANSERRVRPQGIGSALHA